MRFVMTSWLLLLIWVTFNRIYFFILLQPKTNYHAAHLWLSAISYFTRSGLWRDASTVRFLIFLFHTSQEWKACLSFFFFVKHKSWTVARCIYIIGIHLERHHRVLMGMRVEVDYRDRTAPLREWNAMFMLGFHQKKKKTHTSDKTYVYPRPYAAQLSASGPLSHARRAAEGLIEGVKEGD